MRLAASPIARALALLATLPALLVAAGTASAAGPGVGFAKPIFVSRTLAGGEPEVLADARHGTLVYTSHEGTTHLYRPGLIDPFPFGVSYRDQVNLWTSRDGGRTWRRNDYAGTGFFTDPSRNSGFSDPDLTQDEGGRIYNTGINLANDALFSSSDGGLNWDRGTIQCHDGDRPWLAAAKPNEVFMATDPAEDNFGHRIFHSTDGGNSCSTTGIPDFKMNVDGTLVYSGFGKLYYDHQLQRLAEPVIYTKQSDVSSDYVVTGVGVSTWRRGDVAFKPVKAANTTLFAHWPAIAIDSAHNIYLVWDTNDRVKGTTGGCGGAKTPAPNSIRMAVSTDFGRTFSRPVTIAHPRHARVMWPWIAAGRAGRVSIVWYQTSKLVDPDCEPSKVSVYDAQVFQAASATRRSVSVVDAIGRPIHDGSVCQGGVGCVASGKDRRLGDFLTNSLDARGCVLIGTGDTTQPDPLTGGPRPVSLPLFVRQDSGPGLTGRSCGKSAASALRVALSGVPRGCTSRDFTLHVRVRATRRLRAVRVLLDGRRIRETTRGRFAVRIHARRLRGGAHRITVRASDRANRRRTVSVRFRRCARSAVHFTG